MRASEVTTKPVRVFVIADTHDRLPRNVTQLAAVADEIWHLGDVCADHLVDELRVIGPPVTIVRGNCDGNSDWPLVVDLTRNAVRFRLQHIPPARAPTDCDVLLHGHTHVPRDEIIGKVRFLNPGCVTRPNRGAPASVAYLRIAIDGDVRWELLPLPKRQM